MRTNDAKYINLGECELWARAYSQAAKVARARMIRYASVVDIFLPEDPKMNFRVPYGSREIHVLHRFTLSISRPLCGMRKVMLRPEDKNSILLFK